MLLRAVFCDLSCRQQQMVVPFASAIDRNLDLGNIDAADKLAGEVLALLQEEIDGD